MKRLLVDTTFLVDADRDTSIGTLVDDDIAIAAVSVAELRVGVELSTTRFRATREAFFDAVLDSIPVLAYDTDVDGPRPTTDGRPQVGQASGG